jgi:hypothetical protein
MLFIVRKIFTNPNQLEEWVEAAEGIQDCHGIEKALGYLIGEKFYELVFTVHHTRKIARPIEKEKTKFDYNPVQVRELRRHQCAENLDEIYKQKKEISSRQRSCWRNLFP